MGFYIQIKFNNIFRVIKFSEDDLKIIGENKEQLINTVIEKSEWVLNKRNYQLKLRINCSLGFAAHNITECDEVLSVELKNERRIPLNDENIDIIFQFQQCSHFFVELCLNYRHSDVATLVEVSEDRKCVFSNWCSQFFYFKYRTSPIIWTTTMERSFCLSRQNWTW